jgi:hypothetical protein
MLSIVVGVGCNRDDEAIRSYSAPKDNPAPSRSMIAEQPPQAQPMPAEAAGQAPIQWTLPDNWKKIGGESQMRYATIAVSKDDPKAELTVVPLGAGAAATLPNVQRWAGQLKLPTVSDGDLSKYVTQTQVSGEQSQIVDMTGSADTGNPPTRLLAAIIPHAGAAWFFTLKAPEPLVAAQKSNFEKFIRSIQFPTGPAASAPPSSAAGDPQMNPAANVSYRLASFKAPDGWQEQPGTNTMRVNSFRVGVGDQQDEVIISRILKGQSGGLLDNYNRWRGQVGLGPIASESEAGMQTGFVGDTPAMFVTFVGPKPADGPAKELLVAMTIVGRDDWFIKILGPEPLVSAQQTAFRQFLGSLKFAPETK